ncbi:hypothetical protein BR93DRAFT_826661 [Coniochaeta sp. PMI_546]|nr:hypothetical protein BR93DRAFT_826661 [Coniochaeta sp. PMI_546]
MHGSTNVMGLMQMHMYARQGVRFPPLLYLHYIVIYVGTHYCVIVRKDCLPLGSTVPLLVLLLGTPSHPGQRTYGFSGQNVRYEADDGVLNSQ